MPDAEKIVLLSVMAPQLMEAPRIDPQNGMLRLKGYFPARTPYPLDQKIYRRRNVIERMFCKLKNWRRIATRYDRYAQNYLSALALAAIMCQWI